MQNAGKKGTEFDVANDDFGGLEIRNGTDNDRFHYFFGTGRNRLIKTFLLREGRQVDTVCEVILIKEDDGGYSPRLSLWKRDKTKGARALAEDDAPRPVKANSARGADASTSDEWQLPAGIPRGPTRYQGGRLAGVEEAVAVPSPELLRKIAQFFSGEKIVVPFVVNTAVLLELAGYGREAVEERLKMGRPTASRTFTRARITTPTLRRRQRQGSTSGSSKTAPKYRATVTWAYHPTPVSGRLRECLRTRDIMLEFYLISGRFGRSAHGRGHRRRLTERGTRRLGHDDESGDRQPRSR